VLARPKFLFVILAWQLPAFGATPVGNSHYSNGDLGILCSSEWPYEPNGEPRSVNLEGVAQVADAARRHGGLVLCFVAAEYEGRLTSYQSIQVKEILGNSGPYRCWLCA